MSRLGPEEGSLERQASRLFLYFVFSWKWNASMYLLIGGIDLKRDFVGAAGTAIWARADHHGESSGRECWEKRDRGMAPCSRPPVFMPRMVV